MGSVATQFQKGSSGNPKGRPTRGLDLAARLVAKGHRKHKATGRVYYDEIVQVLYDMAVKGNMDALRYIMDRVLGRPAQELKIDTQLPALVFQIIDPRMPMPELAQAPEQEQEAVEGEVLRSGALGIPASELPDGYWDLVAPIEPGVFSMDGDGSTVPTHRDPDHQDSDVPEEG